ncbi:MAG TPA: FAD-dependent tricarballylate dehydrogenase TcuA [Burkholderiales bacterium]|nr:FAD-dependent tricarballylate dehydrogenase TcuA [Burkholderiales bacterium]
MNNAAYDVIVIGGGNAALCAALAARERGAKVALLERAPENRRGGNTAFTGGSFRTVFNGVADIRALVPDLTDDEAARSDFGDYRAEAFLDDIGRVTQYHTDPDLAELLVKRSTETLLWLRDKGIRFIPKYGRQAFQVDGKFKFFGGLVIESVGGGRGLVEMEYRSAQAAGVTIRYRARAVALQRDRYGIQIVRTVVDGDEEEIRGHAVVIACGGFEANREWRTRYLGPGWDLAKVRGSRYNTGDGLRMALEAGAQPHGQWSGCHSVSWDRYAPDYGDLEARMNGQRHSYPMSIMVNAAGERFLDEGADFRNYTYAKYGELVMRQPGGYAWQVYDAESAKFLREEYRTRGVTKATADTIEELASRLEGVDPQGFLRTVREYNAAIRRDVPFDPNVKDGRCTSGLRIDKSNWALPIERPPFEAYAVGTGITFTYGGVKIDTATRILDYEDAPLPGLYAAGEMIGGLFYFNYPAGSGLTSGAVFGRIAGSEAAAHAMERSGARRARETAHAN